jgi:hypothetical protein
MIGAIRPLSVIAPVNVNHVVALTVGETARHRRRHMV